LPPGLVEALRRLPRVDVDALRRVGGAISPGFAAWLEEERREIDAGQEQWQAVAEDRRALRRMLAKELDGNAAVVRAIERLAQAQTHEEELKRQIEELERERDRQTQAFELERERQRQEHAGKMQELEDQIQALKRERSEQERERQAPEATTEAELPTSPKLRAAVQIADRLRGGGYNWTSLKDLHHQINLRIATPNERIGMTTLKSARAWSKEKRGKDL
jgi:hypothetical protein